jgi:hypothetical protein
MDAEACEMMQTQITYLSASLHHIDRTRSEADRWDKVRILEEKLSLPEPLRKSGRFLVNEGQWQVLDRSTSKSTESIVVVFNNLLLRTSVPPKRGKACQVLAHVPMQFVLVADPSLCPGSEHAHAPPQGYRNNTTPTIVLAYSEPQYGIGFVIETTSDSDKRACTKDLRYHGLQMEQFCVQWKIDIDEYGTDEFYWVDRGAWMQAYVQQCQIIVTSHHVCLCWEAFGITERDTIDVAAIDSIRPFAPNGIELVTTSWKGRYQFTALNTPEYTLQLLNCAKQAVLQEQSSMVARTSNSTTTPRKQSADQVLSSGDRDTTSRPTPPSTTTASDTTPASSATATNTTPEATVNLAPAVEIKASGPTVREQRLEAANAKLRQEIANQRKVLDNCQTEVAELERSLSRLEQQKLRQGIAQSLGSSYGSLTLSLCL